MPLHALLGSSNFTVGKKNILYEKPFIVLSALHLFSNVFQDLEMQTFCIKIFYSYSKGTFKNFSIANEKKIFSMYYFLRLGDMSN